jgi:hypothetical protein
VRLFQPAQLFFFFDREQQTQVVSSVYMFTAFDWLKLRAKTNSTEVYYERKEKNRKEKTPLVVMTQPA